MFWAAFFVEERASYDPGPALWCLFAGWAVVVAGAVVIFTRTPFGARATISNDWRIACALVVLACVVVAMATVSEAECCGCGSTTMPAWSCSVSSRSG